MTLRSDIATHQARTAQHVDDALDWRGASPPGLFVRKVAVMSTNVHLRIDARQRLQERGASVTLYKSLLSLERSLRTLRPDLLIVDETASSDLKAQARLIDRLERRCSVVMARTD